MAVVIAIALFVFFITLDYVLLRFRKVREVSAVAPAQVAVAGAAPASLAEPVFVAGYELPDRLYYHRGHTWARVTGPDSAVVGVDDFARRLIGCPRHVAVPRRGTWLRQGGRGARLQTNGRSAELLSPIEGEVVEVNAALRHDPGAPSEDPYGRGWLYKVRSANLAANLRNLMTGSLAHRWIEDARDQLELRLMALSGSVLQDGGEPAPDFARHVEDEDWRRLVQTFLLTGEQES